ncbi:MAG: hypothetical protein ACM3SS_12400, partial [Rhodospirillaceae bacterium]
LTTLLMLLCQTAFAVTHPQPSSRGEPVADTAPCHGAAHGVDADSGAPARSSVCEAAQAVFENLKPPILGVTDLPALLLPAAAILLQPRVVSLAIPETHNACSSPPLILVHCRLLN